MDGGFCCITFEITRRGVDAPFVNVVSRSRASIGYVRLPSGRPEWAMTAFTTSIVRLDDYAEKLTIGIGMAISTQLSECWTAIGNSGIALPTICAGVVAGVRHPFQQWTDLANREDVGRGDRVPDQFRRHPAEACLIWIIR